jgi:hypothetical protein
MLRRIDHLGRLGTAIIGISGGEPLTHPQLDRLVQMWTGKTHKSEMLTLTILCSAIAVQWSLIRTFPLSHPRRWWLEPGALITICTPPVAALAFIPGEASRR